MKKKKGFTLVELLVVIAILAILATVSIIGYTSFIKKANKSNDEAVVAQINLILQASEQEGKPNTLHDALQEVFANGFDVTKLTPTSNGYHYVYHIDKNRFELVESLGDGNSNDWIFVDAKDATNRGYSVYLVSDNREDKAAELVVNSGIDVGSLTITSIKYESNIGQNAIIRTNSLSTSLTIDAVNDTIMHYELANSVNIIRTAYSSYHEKGITSYIECASGKVVVEAEGKVNTVVLTDVKSAGDKAAVVKNNGGEVEHVYATTNDVATANNNAETEHDTLKVEVIAEGGNVLATTEAEAATIIEEKKEAAIESSKSFVQLSCAHKFDGDTCVYCHISKKKLPEISKEELGGFVKVEENKYQITSKNGLGLFVKYINANDTSKIPNGSTIELAVNIDLKDNYWEPISYYLGNYTFDGCGHTIYNMTTSTEFNTRKDVGFFCNAQGWTIKNLNFDICENTDEMAKLGITSVPVLKINDTGEMLDFYSAVKKVNSL